MALDPNIALSVAPHRAPNMLQMLLAVEDMRQRQRYGQDAEEDRAVRRDELKFRIDQLKAAEQAKLDEAAQKTEDDRQHTFVRAVGSLKARPPEERAARYPALIAQLRAADKLPSGPVPETWEQFGGDGGLDEFVAQAMTSEQFVDAFGPQKPAPKQGLMNLGGGFVYDPESRQIVREPPPESSAAEGFTLSPGASRYDAQGQVLATAPAAAGGAAGGFTLAPGGVRYDATGKEIARRPAPVGGGSDPGPLEYVIGADGKAVLLPRSQAIGKTRAAGAERGSSGVQKRVLNFFNRAQQADAELEAMEGQIQQLGLAAQGRMQYAPNFAQTQLGQSYIAAQRAFTEARLRKDSGAAIPSDEFANDRRTYFAQPGDSQATLEQKRRARASMLASLSFESGQALAEFVGDSGEAHAIVEGYKARAAKSGAAATGKQTIGRFQAEVSP